MLLELRATVPKRQPFELGVTIVNMEGLERDPLGDVDGGRARGCRGSKREERARDKEGAAAGESSPSLEVSAAVDGDEARVQILRHAKAIGVGLIHAKRRLQA